jgi:aminopeptidase N
MNIGNSSRTIAVSLINNDYRKMKRLLTAIIAAIFPLLAGAQVVPDLSTMNQPCRHVHPSRFFPSKDTRASLYEYDVTYYRLELLPSMTSRYLSGKTTIHFKTIQETNTLSLDLAASMQVDSVLKAGKKITFTHTANHQLKLQLPETLLLGQSDSVAVFYKGEPANSGFDSYVFELRNQTKPTLWTLSEPYGARDWWPCKQTLNDKADSVEILVTIPASLKAASNGLLQNVSPAPGGLQTWRWKHRYPIATYLIAFAVADYEVYSNEVTINNKKLDILNYIYPENLNTAKNATVRVPEMIQLYSELFGDYPFLEEKYGHAEFGWGGGMEHQTMSFMGGWNYDLMAHELAHQWFGDAVTCGSWQDIWLNEGFASYLTALCYENIETAYWRPWKTIIRNSVLATDQGTVFVDDTSNVSRIFSGRLTYNKASAVLHMLRWVVGDKDFYKGIKSYFTAPEIHHKFGKTPQLQAYLEKESGKDLDVFFNQWIYGQGHPIYQFNWSQNAQGLVTITATQTTSNPSTPLFELPLPFKLKNATQDSLVIFNNNAAQQSWQVLLPFQADSLLFDPEIWIMGEVNSITTASKHLHTLNFSAGPNPVTDQAWINFETPFTGSWDLINVQGQRIQQGQARNVSLLEFNWQTLPAGMYYLQLHSPGATIQRIPWVKI